MLSEWYSLAGLHEASRQRPPSNHEHISRGSGVLKSLGGVGSIPPGSKTGPLAQW